MPGIIVACEHHAARNNGEFLDSLEDLFPDELVNQSALTDPLAPELGANGYTYFKPDPNDPPTKVIIVGKGADRHGRRAVGRKVGTFRAEKYTLSPDL